MYRGARGVHGVLGGVQGCKLAEDDLDALALIDGDGVHGAGALQLAGVAIDQLDARDDVGEDNLG